MALYIGVFLLGLVLGLLLAWLRRRIAMARSPTLDFESLEPDEQQLVLKRTGGTLRRPDGAPLILNDLARLFREETADQLHSAAHYRALAEAEEQAQRLLLSGMAVTHLRGNSPHHLLEGDDDV